MTEILKPAISYTLLITIIVDLILVGFALLAYIHSTDRK